MPTKSELFLEAERRGLFANKPPELVAEARRRFVGEEPAPAESNISKAESFGRGATQGATLGFQDEISPSVERFIAKGDQIIGHLTDNPERIERSEKVLNTPREVLRDEFRKENREAQEANPKTYLAGHIVGSAAPAFLARKVAAANPVSFGAAEGAVQSAGTSEADNMTDIAGDVAKGATVGAILPMVGKGVGALKQKITPAIEKLSESAGRRALGFIKSTIKNKQVGGIEKANEATQTLLDQGVIKWNEGAQKMAERINDLKEAAGKQIGSILDAADESGTKFIRTDQIKAGLKEEFGDLVDDPMFSGLKGKYDAILASIDQHGDAMSFNEAQALKGKLQQLGWKVGRTGEGAEMHKIAYLKVRDAIDSAVEKIDPGMSDAFQQAKKNYAAAAKAEYGVEDAIQRQSGNRLISLTDVITGAGALGSGRPGTAGILIGAKKILEGPGLRAAAQAGHAAGKVTPYVDEALAPVIDISSRALKSPIAASAATAVATDVGDNELLPQSQQKGATLSTIDGSMSSQPDHPKTALSGLNPGAPSPAVPPGKVETAQARSAIQEQQTQRSSERPLQAPYPRPERMGKYSGVLRQAQEKSPEALGATHYVLMQRDPEYRQLYEDSEEDALAN